MKGKNNSKKPQITGFLGIERKRKSDCFRMLPRKKPTFGATIWECNEGSWTLTVNSFDKIGLITVDNSLYP